MSHFEVTPKYSSIRISVPADLKDVFLLECTQTGLDVSEVICFSKDAPNTLSVLFESIAKSVIAKKIIGILKMFNQQRNIRVEVYTDKKIIDLKGYSEEEAQRLLEKCDGIRLTHREDEDNK
ncbi:hypothetical protein [Proteus mirabilis]|uniref:hypothetical protein n=1 Tax=Proteus mirabilis TaxID=584 RepID=UPI0023B33D8E|nr:hypothetical protein [Proteus mirabilis]HCR4047272.1 hypothetical protein [Proteus mirabilis]